MAELIANRYAAALFSLALENKKTDKYYEDVRLVYDSVKDDSEFLAVMKHPQISGEEKLAVLTKAFEGKVEKDILGLFSVAFRKNREAQFLDILSAFIETVKAHKGIVTANVVSARSLTEAQLNKIKEKLETKLKKTVEIEHTVDTALIGGMQIRVCGQLIDNTVRSHLDGIKNRLNEARV